MIERLERRIVLSAQIVSRVLLISGSDSADIITVKLTGTTSLNVSIAPENFTQTFNPSDFDAISCDGAKNDDSIQFSGNISTSILISGGDDADTISGAGSAQIDGGAGDDVLTASDHCTLNGGAGNDSLTGSTAGDSLNGGDGNDT